MYIIVQGLLISINDSARNTLSCLRLPSRVSKQPPHVWELPHRFEFKIWGLAADPSQDLLVVLQLK